MVLSVADLSNHNNSNLSNYPADAYIFKATEGNYFVDKNCDSFVQQAKKAGKPFGVYHFMDGSPWKAQADWFIKNIKGYIGEAVLVLDYEMYGRQGPTVAKQWLDYVAAQTGVKPLIYMSQSVTKEENWSAVVAANYGLWMAQYNNTMSAPGYWKNVAIWQYTSTPYDKNHFYGDVAAWNKYAGKKAGNSKPAPAKPAPKPAGYSTAGKSLETMATDTINGKTGNGDQRKKALGKYYTAVQAIVNHRSNGNANTAVNALKAEVLKGTLGNGDTRKKLLGTYYNKVQAAINGKPAAAKKSNAAIAREIYNGTGGWGNEPQRSQKLRKAGYDPAAVQREVNKLF